jgi:hypothetical protein
LRSKILIKNRNNQYSLLQQRCIFSIFVLI